MVRFLPILGAVLVILIGLFAGRIGSELSQSSEDPVPDTSTKKEKNYTVELASGLDYRLGSYPEVRLLYFDECRIEKRKYGGFSFGAFNVLVIDQLKIILPPLVKQVSNGRGGSRDVSSHEQIRRDFRDFLSQYPHFSSVRVNGLTVGVALSLAEDGEDGVEEVLTARRAEIGSKGVLNLVDCEFLTEDGERVRCKDAELSLESPLLLSTKYRTFRVASLSGRSCMDLTELILK